MTAYKAPARTLTVAVVGLAIGYAGGWSASLFLLALFAALLCWLFRLILIRTAARQLSAAQYAVALNALPLIVMEDGSVVWAEELTA